jgi:tRNA A37 methylthiotransferase MiaB
MAAEYRSRFVGTTTSVLWESRRDDAWEGLTDTYIRVRTQSTADLTNRLTPALLTEAREDGLWAELTGDDTPGSKE